MTDVTFIDPPISPTADQARRSKYRSLLQVLQCVALRCVALQYVPTALRARRADQLTRPWSSSEG
jgi:hypothetical protein